MRRWPGRGRRRPGEREADSRFQVAIVLLFVPAAYLVRDTVAYRRIFVPVGSVAIMILAGVWLAERLSGA